MEFHIAKLQQTFLVVYNYKIKTLLIILNIAKNRLQ